MNNKNIVSIRSAVDQIKSNDSIWVSGRSETTEEFLLALAERANELKNVTIIAENIEGTEALMKYRGTFRVIVGISNAIRTTYANGDKVKFIMGTSNTAVSLICKEFGVNTLVAEICPPNGKGECLAGGAGKFIAATVSTLPGTVKQIGIVSGNLVTETTGIAKAIIPVEKLDVLCSRNVFDENVTRSA